MTPRVFVASFGIVDVIAATHEWPINGPRKNHSLL